jgi:hypothetical protein
MQYMPAYVERHKYIACNNDTSAPRGVMALPNDSIPFFFLIFEKLKSLEFSEDFIFVTFSKDLRYFPTS